MRKVPARAAVASKGELGPDRVATLPPPAPTGPVPQPEFLPQVSLGFPPALPAVAAAVTPLSPARYKVQFTATAGLREKLERLQALTRDDLATVVEAAVTEKLERLEAKRFGMTKIPRDSVDEPDTSRRSRHLPASVRRRVRQRDGDQCTFALRGGARCPERRALEFHHREPYARGGAHDADNVCLMCRQHNVYAAELDYGKQCMEKYRRRGDRASEGPSEYIRWSTRANYGSPLVGADRH